MIDIKLIRENSDLVKENIKKKFQNEKLGLVDEVYEYDKTYREYKMKIDELRAKRNELSSSIGLLMRDGKKDEAEEVKKQIGAATAAMTEDRMEVKGRNLLTGLPETITVTTEDINEAMKDSLNEILRIIKLTLEQTPPELASDIMERGITLSGGLSLLRNIDRLISDETGMPVFIADEPEKCVVKGVGMALDNIEVLKKATKTRK